MSTDTGKVSGFNTQPPEGGWVVENLPIADRNVSTHSRLKAAASLVSTRSPEGLFQHTAA